MRLLLSIDRRQDANEAMETVELAATLRDSGVVGIDLSGNPTVGVQSTIKPITYWLHIPATNLCPLQLWP